MGCGSSKEAVANDATHPNAGREAELKTDNAALPKAAAAATEEADAEEAAQAAQAAEERAAAIKAADEEMDILLSNYISDILQLKTGRTAISTQYVQALRAEGFDTPDDFDNLTVDELKEEPFCFKRGHLLKVLTLHFPPSLPRASEQLDGAFLYTFSYPPSPSLVRVSVQFPSVKV